MIRTDTEPCVPTLTARLRSRTDALHRAAERHPFVRGLLEGCLPTSAFVRYTAALLPVYAALEDGLAQTIRVDERLCRFDWDSLARRTRLDHDLRALGGAPVQNSEYGDHLLSVGKRRPIALLGHAYCRYLGDLSGGRLIARQAQRVLGVGSQALSFYDFGEPNRIKAQFRAALDSLPCSGEEMESVLDEAAAGFVLSTRLFDFAWPVCDSGA